MFWFQTGVLSDKQIKRLMGKKVFIYPFKSSNLKGSTYNLTASTVAKSVNTGKLIINKSGEIEIKAGDTALIQTEESIYVEKDICGTYHSKVKLVSKGLAHISTTLDPLYFGTSLIAVHNYSEETITLRVGETFVSLMLHKMPTSTKILHDNPAFRQDLIDMNFNKDSFYDDEIDDNQKEDILGKIEKWKSQNWRIEKEYLIEAVNEELKEKMKDKRFKTVDVGVIIFSIIIVISILYAIKQDLIDGQKYIIVAAIMPLVYPILQAFGNMIKSIIKGE